MSLPFLICILAFAVFAYTYVGYPAMLWLVGRFRSKPLPEELGSGEEWPRVSITVPMYNEEAQARGLVESLLDLDYPRDRLQILVVSDASSDATDEIVRGYADRGVELHRMPERGGKTKAENAAAELITGDIVVNTDASIRIHPDALKKLLVVFRDPEIGLASGRDRSVGVGEAAESVGEAGYVGYEMAVRDLETETGSIIGASGCFYAIRVHLHRLPLPDSLSRDFAAALHTQEHGYRAVSVSSAVCDVPRTPSLHKEFRRKVRTITRGIQTLIYKRALLNPFRHGGFALKLFSHKICRWLLPWAAMATYVSLGFLAPGSVIAATLLGLGTAVLLLGAAGWFMAAKGSPPKVLRVPAFVLAGNLAAARALLRVLAGDRDALWEPTRRDPTPVS